MPLIRSLVSLALQYGSRFYRKKSELGNLLVVSAGVTYSEKEKCYGSDDILPQRKLELLHGLPRYLHNILHFLQLIPLLVAHYLYQNYLRHSFALDPHLHLLDTLLVIFSGEYLEFDLDIVNDQENCLVYDLFDFLCGKESICNQ